MQGSVLAFLVLVGTALAVPVWSQAQAAASLPPHPVNGVVVDENGIAIAGAELTVRREGRVVAILRTSETGAFEFAHENPGTLEISTRRIGFKGGKSTVYLNHRGSIDVLRIMLESLPTEVAPVVVSGASRLDLFYQHRKENAFGRFMDREEIEKSGARYTSDLFRTIPGASLRTSRRYGNIVRFRGCQPTVWIDRVPIRDVELDEVTGPEEIAGLEIYTSSSSVPPQFMDRSGRSCGAIVVWTRIN